jgi:hypothetical protein
VNVVEADFLRRLVKLRRDGDVALDTGEVLEQLERALPADREWDEDSWKDDRRLERQHRKARRNGSFDVECRHLAHSKRVFPADGQITLRRVQLLGQNSS